MFAVPPPIIDEWSPCGGSYEGVKMSEIEDAFVELDDMLRSLFEKIYKIERRLKKIEDDIDVIKRRLRR